MLVNHTVLTCFEALFQFLKFFHTEFCQTSQNSNDLWYFIFLEQTNSQIKYLNSCSVFFILQPQNVPGIGELALGPLMFGASSTLLNADHYGVYFKGMPVWNGKVGVLFFTMW